MSENLDDARRNAADENDRHRTSGLPGAGQIGHALRVVPSPESDTSSPARSDSTQYRVCDVLLSSIILVVLSPLMLLIALAVRLSSPGPALFRQTRVGFRGEPFELLKFRTMKENSDDSVHRLYVTKLLMGLEPEESSNGVYKLECDPRVTSVGRILRRLSLDELPQLINVLVGDMSLVGPRPALSWEVALFDPIYASRFLVRPGMTGLWQVSGRNKVSVTKGLDLDIEFVRRRSLLLYAEILLKTIPTIVMGNGAR
jgi:lipopolysaccharide/colanic/teichoic acid biosynthesis glycosyltransferase